MTIQLLKPDDVPPGSDDDVEPLRCQVDGCQNTLTYSGRGRKPKYCDEHKSTSSGSNTGSGTKRTNWAVASQVEQALTQYLGYTAIGVMWINPVDGKIIAKGGPAVAHELVELAKIDKRLRKPLEFIAMPGKYGPLAVSVGSIIIPIMANHGLLPQFVLPEPESGKGVNENG